MTGSRVLTSLMGQIGRGASIPRVNVLSKKMAPTAASIRPYWAKAQEEEVKLPAVAGRVEGPTSLRDIQMNHPAIQQRDAPTITANKMVRSIRLLRNDSLMQINWLDKSVSKYPFAWLRDNCQCESCYDSEKKKRRVMIGEFNVDGAPQEVKNEMNGSMVRIKWDDGHASQYTSMMLQDHCFNEGMKFYMRENYSPSPRLWNNKLCDSMKLDHICEWSELVEDETKLLSFLATLQVVGFAKITGAPCGNEEEAQNTLLDLIKLCSPREAYKIHEQAQNGPIQFVPKTQNAGFQTSLPYYNHVPEVQLMLCQHAGKEVTSFVDGFAVAEKVPDRVFKMLSEHEVAFMDVTPEQSPGSLDRVPFAEKHLRRRLAPTFELNKRGQVDRINYNNEDRDSAMVRDDALHSPLDDTAVGAFYGCLQEFDNMMHSEFDPNNQKDFSRCGFDLTLQPGDLIATYNGRVLVQNGNGSTVYKAYFDRDELESKINQLSQDRNLHGFAEEDS